MTRNQPPKSEADVYKKQFWTEAARHLPHHASAKMARTLKNETLIRRSYRGKHAEISASALQSYSEKEVAEYSTIVAQTDLWHGTGRYQYQGEEIVDVLSHILSAGCLRPMPDAYAVMLGGEHMVSISATPLRIIARCYADMHGKGALEKNRFGSSLWWVSYYYGPFYATLFTKHTLTIARQYKKWHEATSNDKGERTWGKKVNTNAKHVWDAFGLGSDIPDNYPILIGLKNQADIATTPGAIARVEARFTRPIPLDSFTHFEVPGSKVAETKSLLEHAGVNLPVLPIELGEYVASQQSIAELLQAA